MYVIVVYDIEQKRVGKVLKFLRQYLNWVQNSAFEGEVTAGKLAQIKAGLSAIIEPEYDSVYLYVLRDAKWVDKQIMGQSRGPTDNII